MNALIRLLRYATPYRSRLIVALVAMIVYAGGSAFLAWLVKPIFDRTLSVTPTDAGWIAGGILLAYFLKGVGGYISGYLMADVGQRVVRDLRNGLFRHILNQSARCRRRCRKPLPI